MRELDRAIAPAESLVVVAGERELVCQVRVAARPAGAVADPFELLDRAAIARDSFRNRAAILLDHAEIDQAAADFLDRAHALGHLEAPPKRCGSLIQTVEVFVDAADHSQRGRETSDCLFVLEDLECKATVLERFSEATFECFGTRQL